MKPQIEHRVKSLIVFCILFVLLSVAHAYAETSFAKIIADAGQPQATAQCKDGGLVSFTYWRRNFDPYNTVHLIRKVNRSGGLVWEKKLVFKGQEIPYIQRISETKDGGFILLGHPVVKLSSNGRVQWAKNLTLSHAKEENDGVYLDDMSTLHNGGFIASGNYVHPTGEWTARFAPVLVKFNSAGKVVSATRFEHPEITGIDYFTQKIVATPDGGSFLARTSELPSNRVVVIRSDKDGKIVWSYRYEIKNFSFNTVASTSDNGVILAGNDTEKGKQFFLLKLNSKGKIEWAEGFALSGGVYISQLSQDYDGGYLGTGTLTSDTSRAFLFKTDPAGKIVFASTFKGSGTSYGASIFSSPGKGFLFLGSYDDWVPDMKAETMILLKLNSQGVVPGCRLLSSLKSSRQPIGEVKITTIKISPSKLSLLETAFEGSITSHASVNEVSTECQ